MENVQESHLVFKIVNKYTNCEKYNTFTHFKFQYNPIFIINSQ